MAGLVPALVDLDDAPEIIVLGGNPAAMPSCVSHIREAPHPPTNAGWTLVGLPGTARRADVDLIHAPAYTAPVWAPSPVVVTIHDVSYARHPEWYPYRRDAMRRWFYRRSARAATQIVTDSEFSASEIVEAYAIPRDRITVVPLGVDAGFVPTGIDGDGSRRPYLLHVGDLHERRNLAVVIEAMITAKREFPAAAALSLVLAGEDRGSLEMLRTMAVMAGAADMVDYVGRVSDERLGVLYRGATALVYPSRYEGFGLPLVEAMASGTPVIASRAASIPEVVGDAGLLLDPDDLPAWTAAIVAVLSDRAQRLAMRSAGLRRAEGFTWTSTARKTLDVYHRALQV